MLNKSDAGGTAYCLESGVLILTFLFTFSQKQINLVCHNFCYLKCFGFSQFFCQILGEISYDFIQLHLRFILSTKMYVPGFDSDKSPVIILVA